MRTKKFLVIISLLTLASCQSAHVAPPRNVVVDTPTQQGKQVAGQVDEPAEPDATATPTAVHLVAMLEGVCAVLDDGTVHCWGGNAQDTSPRMLQGVDRAVDVTVGYDHATWSVEAVVVKEDGTVWAVPLEGGNPRMFDGLRDVVDVEGRVTGMQSIEEGLCAIHRDRSVTCFEQGRIEPQDAGKRVDGWTGVKDLAVGWLHTCSLREDGVRCVEHGQLATSGGGTKALAGTAGALTVACEHTAACVSFDDGRVACADLDAKVPASVALPDRGRAMSVQQGGWPGPESLMICTAHEQGVTCRRDESIGSGHTLPALDPGRVTGPGFDDVRQVIQTPQAACARKGDGTVACWGHNGKGALARPYVGRVVKPVRVAGVPPVDHVVAGNDYSCALTVAKEVWCWGRRVASSDSADPRKVPGLTDVERLVAGAGYACAWDAQQDAHCFFGTASRRKPVRVPPLDGALSVGLPSMGYLGTVAALLPGGTVHIGPAPGFDTLAGLQLVAVPGWDQVEQVSLDAFGSLVFRRSNGEVLHARVRDGKVVRPAAVVPALHGAVEVGPRHARMPDGSGRVWSDAPGGAASWRMADPFAALVDPNRCARTAAGDVACWSVKEPEVVMRDVAQAAGSADHLCGVREDGSVWCLGENRAGQCGAGVGVEVSAEPLDVVFAPPPGS